MAFNETQAHLLLQIVNDSYKRTEQLKDKFQNIHDTLLEVIKDN
jgi:hypothetical protein